MDRRQFFKSSAPALTLALGGGFGAKVYGAPSSGASAESSAGAAAGNDRILVAIQLFGGNDGLNTVIASDRYDDLVRARPAIVPPKDKVLALTPETGLHPALAELQGLYKDGKVAVVQNVGYPSPNQSHFRSTDIWLTASNSNQVLESGWLGRYLQIVHPGFPANYPNADFPDPPAVQIGSVLSQAFNGEESPLGLTLTNPNSLFPYLGNDVNPAPDTAAGNTVEYVRMVAKQTQKYGDRVKAAAAKAANKSALYPATGNNLANSLKIVARLIAGGLQTRVYMVSQGGFDTHAAQVEALDRLAGQQPSLLSQLSTAIAAFQDDLRLLGLEDRVLCFTQSEFGRRIKANASLGTDHGTAAPLFVVGKGVKGGILGANPVIPANLTEKDNLPMEFDFRRVYAGILGGWMGLGSADLKKVLLQDFDPLPLSATSTGIRAGSPGLGAAGFSLAQNSPNPCRGLTRIAFTLEEADEISLTLHDTRGRLLRRLVQGRQGRGLSHFTLDASMLASGRYTYRLQSRGRTLSRTLSVP